MNRRSNLTSPGCVVLALPLLLVGCVGADARPRPVDRVTQARLILEEVLRYEVQQFAASEGGPDSVACVAVREEVAMADPGPDLLRRLARYRVEPASACRGTQTLVAGPVEWLRDDEALVRGGRIRASKTETRLAYRVVREEDRWVCVGPVTAWDPL